MSLQLRKCCQIRIAVDFKCTLAPCHSCAYCGALWFCEGEWSSVSKPCQLGWARTGGGEIWERNKLNLADTLFSFPNMLRMSSERQTGLKGFGIRTLFKHLEVIEHSGWLAEMTWLVFLQVSVVTHCCPSSDLPGATLGTKPPQSYTPPNLWLLRGRVCHFSHLCFPSVLGVCLVSSVSVLLKQWMKPGRMAHSFFRRLSLFWHWVSQLLGSGTTSYLIWPIFVGFTQKEW